MLKRVKILGDFLNQVLIMLIKKKMLNGMWGSITIIIIISIISIIVTTIYCSYNFPSNKGYCVSQNENAPNFHFSLSWASYYLDQPSSFLSLPNSPLFPHIPYKCEKYLLLIMNMKKVTSVIKWNINKYYTYNNLAFIPIKYLTGQMVVTLNGGNNSKK